MDAGAGRSVAGSRPVVALLCSALTATTLGPLVDASPLGRHPRWGRTNFQGRTVRLGGVATALGTAVGSAVGSAVGASHGTSPLRAATVVTAAALAGGYDDLFAPGREVAGDKGLAGHLAAARAGRISGGVVKVFVIGAAAWWGVGPLAKSWPDRAVRAVAVAGAANLVNLLDLRPGRAAKVAVLMALPLIADGAGAAALGAACAALPGDLAQRTMLGDTGANALGAALGLAAVGRGRLPALVMATVVTAAAVVSERVSFSAVIEATPWLRRLDRLGR